MKKKPKFDYTTMDFKSARNMFLGEITLEKDIKSKSFKNKFKKKNDEAARSLLKEHHIIDKKIDEVITTIKKFKKIKKKSFLDL